MRLGATGKFISVEGIEGVGKSTQIRELSRMLADRGIPHTMTREPGGTPLAEIIREVVLTARDERLPDSAELLLMFAARAVHLCNLIEPRLEAGEWVLCDRFTDATYAYQGAGRGLNEDRIRMLETFVQGERRPDLTLLLDAPVSVGLARSRRRNAGAGHRDDRFEAERADFFERVRAAYLARAAAEPARFVVIDASESPEQVSAQLLAALRARLWIS